MEIKKVYADALTTLAKGTDAGIYKLNPERVEIVNCVRDVRRVLAECEKTGKSVTFKAGGTSLSGQTITDSVLMEIGPDYGKVEISLNGHLAKFPCGITGEEANRLLKPYGRKLGPSPASIKSARIGGIVANNSSGSGYGIIYNSYNTIQDMEILLADGTFLDTASSESRRNFMKTHVSLLERLMNFRLEILLNPDMQDRILSKYELKNTCGYGMNSFLDYSDPYDILMHLMVGSEGTLGFISSVTFETVPDEPLKASALIYFPSLMEASRAIGPLRQCKVSAAELMDRNALHAVEDEPGMPEILRALPDDAVALLIDTASNGEEELQIQFRDIEERLADVQTLYPVSFTTDPKLYATYWRVRNGLFTSAAGRRPRGTVSIIEDIAFRAHKFPLWTRHTPSGTSRFKRRTGVENGMEMVYFPACITRTMGASADYEDVDTRQVGEIGRLMREPGGLSRSSHLLRLGGRPQFLLSGTKCFRPSLSETGPAWSDRRL
ncbi:FAD-binding oxidoreductase [Parabacteroides sp. ZJ-118]|uniref:FAD-binding oxidoreductase n=1 Tax=Parabacteroides sp. ZJ-118 TaxID=2709398 RepID=UPI001F14BFC1|nr:FAD-binding oxidoreductase [Parabacteroides sp. ZJ-118]